MIKLTKLDGSEIFVNNANIQWIERLPDTAVTFLGGARVLVRESCDDVVKKIDDRLRHEESLPKRNENSASSQESEAVQ